MILSELHPQRDRAIKFKLNKSDPQAPDLGIISSCKIGGASVGVSCIAECLIRCEINDFFNTFKQCPLP